MSRNRCFFAVFACCLGVVASQSAFALRCDGELVTEGDTKLSVRNKCGEPSWVDRWPEEIVKFPDTDFEHRISRHKEYNSAADQLIFNRCESRRAFRMVVAHVMLETWRNV